MAIISIFSGPFCQGDDVATAVSGQLGYPRIEDEVLDLAASRFDVSREKLLNALSGSSSFLGRAEKDREKHIAYLRYALAEKIQIDNVIHHGFVGHLLPRSMNHVIRVLLIANIDYRVQIAMKEANVNEKHALDLVNRMDKKRAQWSDYTQGHPPYESRDFDLVLTMHDLNPNEAASQIFLSSGSEAVQTTEASQQAASNFLLAATVHLIIAEKGHRVDVQADNGHVTILINKYTSRIGTLERQLESIAMEIEGVRSARSIPGTGFVPPSLMPTVDLPKRALLVDDEKEFVNSLSERLETRHLESSVVYDGEQALEYVRENKPDVMVLDLKMPGIDGIEVLRQVKKDHPTVKVIILTGHGSDREEKIAFELGAFAYLSKPVKIEVLAEAMKAAYSKSDENDRGDENG